MSNAISSGGVATASGSGSRSHSNRAVDRDLAARPQRVGGQLVTARAMSAKRFVWSTPWRLSRRTRSLFL
jgi:hypothetical protein